VSRQARPLLSAAYVPMLTSDHVLGCSKLYREGGVRRFYQGITASMVLGPASRFGDTACNSGMLHLLDSQPATRDLPIALKTAAGSVASALWRVVLLP
jgi:hypothetical protein